MIKQLLSMRREREREGRGGEQTKTRNHFFCPSSNYQSPDVPQGMSESFSWPSSRSIRTNGKMKLLSGGRLSAIARMIVKPPDAMMCGAQKSNTNSIIIIIIIFITAVVVVNRIWRHPRGVNDAAHCRIDDLSGVLD